MLVDRYTTEQLDYPGDGLRYLNGKPFAGILEFRSSDGMLEAEEEFRGGLPSGMKREWHPSGVLASEAECSLGAFHGRVRRWYESGLPESEAVYEYGIRLRGQVWDELGTLVEDVTLSETDPAFGLLGAFRMAEVACRSEGDAAGPDAVPGSAN